MKIFLSYRFTGEDKKMLSAELGAIKKTLRESGHDVFCSLDYEDFFTNKHMPLEEIYNYCCTQLQHHDVLLVYIKSQLPSKGITMEVNCAKEWHIPTVFAIRTGVDNVYGSGRSVLWDDLEQLCTKMHDFFNGSDISERNN